MMSDSWTGCWITDGAVQQQQQY